MPDFMTNDNIRQNCLNNIAAATMMAESLNFCLERKHLGTIVAKDSPFSIECGERPSESVSWLRIVQVGRPVNDPVSVCFSYMNKILMSCAIPNSKLKFLVVSDGATCELFLGLSNAGDKISLNKAVADLKNFAQVCWPGLIVERIDKDTNLLNSCYETEFDEVRVFTGIPTVSDKGFPVSTVEHLIGGMRGKKFYYLVVAEPVSNSSIDQLLVQCRDIGGQIESIKTMNVSKSVQYGKSEGETEGINVGSMWSHSKGTSEKDTSGLLIMAGLSIAATFFAPAAPIFSIASSLLGFGAGAGAMGLLPQKSQTDTTGGSVAVQKSITTTLTESAAQSVSKTLVNKHADAAAKKNDAFIQRLEMAKATGAWTVTSMLFSECNNDATAWQLKSVLSGEESSLEPVRIHNVTRPLAERHCLKASSKPPRFYVAAACEGKNIRFSHPFGDDFSQLKTLLTTRELSALINMPLHSVPGVTVVDAAPEFSLTPQALNAETKTIEIGKMLYGGSKSSIPVALPVDTLSRHALVCGINGTGKTNTVLTVLDGMAAANRPFMVIEPAKTEYVDWAIKYNASISDPRKKIKIFIPGCENYAKGNFVPEKLRLNPFEVISLEGSEMRVLSHIDRLKATFATAFPMQDILPVVLEHLLYFVYGKAGLLENKAGDDIREKKFPKIAMINKLLIADLMKDLGYAKENSMNISAALRTRFKSLRYGWKGELLCNDDLMSGMGMSWTELFNTPVVVNLSYAGDDQDRAFLMSLLLQMLYEYRIAESETQGYSFSDNVCRHLVVVEEAHRVMTRCLNPQLPQYKSAQMFSNFLSEVRAYGQGMMIVDQVPSRLIEDAIKNTNIKIIHKLVAADDASAIAQSIGLSDREQKVIPKLSIGQAVLAGFNSANVLSSNTSDVYLAQINKY